VVKTSSTKCLAALSSIEHYDSSVVIAREPSLTVGLLPPSPLALRLGRSTLRKGSGFPGRLLKTL
jgi:hypothetical protein